MRRTLGLQLGKSKWGTFGLDFSRPKSELKLSRCRSHRDVLHENCDLFYKPQPHTPYSLISYQLWLIKAAKFFCIFGISSWSVVDWYVCEACMRCVACAKMNSIKKLGSIALYLTKQKFIWPINFLKNSHFFHRSIISSINVILHNLLI